MMAWEMNEVEAEVWRKVRALNRTWTAGDVDALHDHFHPDMIAITPTDRERLVGREACVAAWRRFAESAAVLSWRETDPLVRVYGDAAVVAYRYELTCKMDDREMEMAGRDMFFLVREDGRWLAVADQFSGYPGAEVPG